MTGSVSHNLQGTFKHTYFFILVGGDQKDDA